MPPMVVLSCNNSPSSNLSYLFITRVTRADVSHKAEFNKATGSSRYSYLFTLKTNHFQITLNVEKGLTSNDYLICSDKITKNQLLQTEYI